MKHTSMFAAAMAVLIPTAALAQEPDRYGFPPYPAPHRQEPIITQSPRDNDRTQLRVVPPRSGAVFVFDGPRPLGRFERAGTMSVEAGRSYVVVAIRGSLFLWGGNVVATGPSIDLSWGPEAAPSWDYGQQQPSWEPSPSVKPYGSQRLLHELDRQDDDRARLSVLQAEVHRRRFTTAQADPILGRFRTDQYRLEALSALRDRLVDPENRFNLTRHFRRAEMRRQAIEVLHR